MGADNRTQTSFNSLTDLGSGNNVRSAVLSGNNLFGAGGAGGIRTAPVGTVGGTSARVSDTAATGNFRQVNTFGGQLFATTGAGTAGIYAIGAGVSTAASQPLTPIITSANPYAFFFADLSTTVSFGSTGLDTLYVADDSAAALTKYSLVGGSWVSNGTIGVAADAYRGLTGAITGSGVTLFATRRGGSNAAGGGQLVSLLDASGYNGALAGTPTVLASAITGTAFNTAFRGVAVVVPEANTLGLLGFALPIFGGVFVVRRRK